MLVDDVLFNLMPLKAIIDHTFSRKCDEAINGVIAVQMYLANMTKTCCNVRYRAIFTDIQMPEMDGITEAIEILKHEAELRRANPALPKQRITFISAYSDAETVERCRKLGIPDYLTKPVVIKRLAPILETIFP